MAWHGVVGDSVLSVQTPAGHEGASWELHHGCVCHRLRLHVHTPHLWGLGVKRTVFAVLLGNANLPGPPRDPLALNASPGCQSTSFWFGVQMALSRGTAMSEGVSGKAQQEVLLQKQMSVICGQLLLR